MASFMQGLDWFKRHPRALFPLAVAIGLLLLVLLISLKTRPKLADASQHAVPVDVIVVKPQAVAPTIEGFGRIEPKQIWQAIAEVGGRIMYRHPQLYKGQILTEGTVLLKIDPTDHQIKQAAALADLQATQVQLQGKDLQEKNLKLSLAIEQQQLTLSEQETARKKQLKQQNLISQSELDQQQKNLLSQQQRLQDLHNQLTLLPNDKALLEAQLLQAQSRAEEAQRQLDKTEIKMPWTGRIASVEVENKQVIAVQQSLLKVHGLDTVLVNAQFSMHDMRVLAKSLSFDSQQMPDISQLGLSAELILEGFGFKHSWPAYVARISDTVDPTQATVGVILEVQQDYTNLRPDLKPPLVNGMFVRARLTGKPQPHWRLPLKALHGNELYVLNAEQRLQKIAAQVLFFDHQHVIVQAALQPGDQVISTDLIPAIPSMQLMALHTEIQP